MAFIKHIPCTHCGSKDNLAEYTDHFYCFGCGYSKSKLDVRSLHDRLLSSTVVATEDFEIPTISTLPIKALSWLYAYGLTPLEIQDMGYNTEKELLVLYKSKEYFQGRYFGESNSTPKYLSRGKKPNLILHNLPFDEKPSPHAPLVLTEDYISALKVSRYCPAMPLWGSTLSDDTCVTIASKGIKSVYVWLDRDKAKESVLMRSTLLERGIKAQSIITPMDPKCYSKEDILERLYG